jgi:hypothetical protein
MHTPENHSRPAAVVVDSAPTARPETCRETSLRHTISIVRVSDPIATFHFREVDPLSENS